MKKLSILNKFLFFINSIVATTLLISYLLPYVSPKTFASFSVFSLFVPVLIIINLVFTIYWLLRLKKQFLLSTIVLLLGWIIASPFYKFSSKEVLLLDDVKIMSYNVRMFNNYKWNKDILLADKAYMFIEDTKPDILAIQEFYNSEEISFTYPYKYIKNAANSKVFGLAIYSKYPIINSGSFNFKNTSNNAIFIDIVKEKDTVRVYNLHLESLHINPRKENFGEKSKQKLFKRLKIAFKKQAYQIDKVLANETEWKGKKIICGDFNNTAYSWVYKQLSKNKKDAFLEAGSGFGKTFDYFFPTRIDFILTDKSIQVNHFKNFNVKYSDHFPIMAHLHLE